VPAAKIRRTYAAGSPEWPVERTKYLRAAWAAGHSARLIAIAIGVTKSSVIGKVHRLGLAPRPSPIRHGGPQSGLRAERKRRAEAGRLPPPGGHHLPRPVGDGGLPSLARPVVLPAPKPVPRFVAKPAPFARVVTCVYPIGSPGERGFRWCSDDAKMGSPYCPRHHALCYVRVRDLRDDAA